jgi:hemerythrin-like metal-binding protein
VPYSFVTGVLGQDLTLGHPAIDTDHQDMLRLYVRARTAPEPEFVAALTALLAHLTEHFTREEALMLAAGDRNLSEHRAEHNRILGDLSRFVGHSRGGKTHFARAWIKDMFPDWLRRHIMNMDSAAVANLATPKARRLA